MRYSDFTQRIAGDGAAAWDIHSSRAGAGRAGRGNPPAVGRRPRLRYPGAHRPVGHRQPAGRQHPLRRRARQARPAPAHRRTPPAAQRPGGGRGAGGGAGRRPVRAVRGGAVPAESGRRGDSRRADVRHLRSGVRRLWRAGGAGAGALREWLPRAGRGGRRTDHPAHSRDGAEQPAQPVRASLPRATWKPWPSCARPMTCG